MPKEMQNLKMHLNHNKAPQWPKGWSSTSPRTLQAPYSAQPGDAMTMIEAFLEPDFVFNLITGATGTQAAQTGTKVERSKIGFAALTNNQPSQPNDV